MEPSACKESCGAPVPLSPQSQLVERPFHGQSFELPDQLDKRTTEGLAEVWELMQKEGLNFDEARLRLVLMRMEEIGVDSTGMPSDPRAFILDRRESHPSGEQLAEKSRLRNGRRRLSRAASGWRRGVRQLFPPMNT